jgi:hypothetical protein
VSGPQAHYKGVPRAPLAGCLLLQLSR